MQSNPITISTEMTFPLWGLVILILWTIFIVVLLITVRIRHLAAGGSIKDFGTPNDESLLWRLFRVQSNLVENLPLYIGVVFLLSVRGASVAAIDLLVSVYILARLFHSIIHIAGADPNLRIFGLVIQFGCLMELIALAIFNVIPGI
jgi:uncharacterized membrane protein YecN with MAPEG domain